MITDERGVLLNAPTAVSVEITEGSTTAQIFPWASWMEGCTIVIDGEPVENQIRVITSSLGFDPVVGTVTLKFPATQTASGPAYGSATVYHNSVAIGADVMDVRKPIRVDSQDLMDMSSDFPTRRFGQREDYGLVRNTLPLSQDTVVSTAGAPRFYRITTWTQGNTVAAGQRMQLYPAPDSRRFLEYKCSLTPPVVTDLAATTTLPIPFQFVQSVFLPIAERVLMDCPYFRGTASGNTILASEAQARLLLAKLMPSKTNRKRIIPLG